MSNILNHGFEINCVDDVTLPNPVLHSDDDNDNYDSDIDLLWDYEYSMSKEDYSDLHSIREFFLRDQGEKVQYPPDVLLKKTLLCIVNPSFIE